ncbi:hypothetical protein [Dyella sp.]|uniref:hypothetical protein n=1 Tax=Dyella sp. TaxID=1869338 RepID=UPI002FDA730E
MNDVGGSYTVCHDVAVPPSYALVGIQTNAGCNHGTSYTVAPASPGMRICNLSQTVGGAPYQMPFPDGYIVQTIQEVQPQQSQCGGATAIYIIQPVAEGTTACSGTQIPTGWSYTASSPSPGSCGTFERIELHQSVAGMRICSQSPYPNGFVVGAVESMAACGLQERYVLQPTSDGVKACGPTHVPAGYVITNTNQSGQCGSYQTLTLRAAYDGVVVCPASPIPDRYVIQSAVPYNGCENFTTANQLKYIP